MRIYNRTCHELLNSKLVFNLHCCNDMPWQNTQSILFSQSWSIPHRTMTLWQSVNNAPWELVRYVPTTLSSLTSVKLQRVNSPESCQWFNYLTIIACMYTAAASKKFNEASHLGSCILHCFCFTLRSLKTARTSFRKPALCAVNSRYCGIKVSFLW